MKYKNTTTGIFVSRPNRFIAKVLVGEKEETVHVKNTGRCKELLIQGVKVVLEISDNPNRKTKYDLIAVYKKDFGLINMDSQAPNKVVAEWLERKNFDFVKPEFSFGKSRIDFYMEKDGSKYLLEVKGCTLEIGGKGFFPDAPTERGVKHLRELAAAVKSGFKSILAFVIQMEGISEVFPNIETHPEFGAALEEAKNAGVEIWFLKCKVGEDFLEIVD